MPGPHTSLPRWPTAPPDVDPSGRALGILSITDGARAIAEHWRTQHDHNRPLWTHHTAHAASAGLELLREQIVTATVGWRLMVAGPEVHVLRARAVAIGLGMVPAEIREHVTGNREKRVYCPHCKDLTETTLPVGDSVPCAGCRRSLHIYHHLSRRLGAYLGFMADAEEVA